MSQPAGSRDIVGVVVLLGLVALSFVGRFLPGAHTWGFHLHAYLPLLVTAAWLLLAVVLFLPPVQQRIGGFITETGPRLLFSPVGPWVLAVAAGVLFAVLAERSYFMGDGYLVGELVERGMPFRSFDNMDYLLHFQIYKSLRNPLDPGAVSSFAIYRWGAVVAGSLGVLLITYLARLLPWQPWQRFLVVALFLVSGPTAMFFGYVESYGFLLVFLSAFLLAGVLALEGRFPLWVASLFYGLAAFMHLTAAFAAPALLYLAQSGPQRPAFRRWLLALGPAAIVFLVSVLAHVATGYDEDFFRREFLEAKNAKSLWVSWTGAHGFLSLEHGRDLANLALLVLPVPLVLVLLRARTVLGGIGGTDVQFLVVQLGALLVFVLGIDRKLGGARDWDLFAAHGFGLVLLAVWALGRDTSEADPTMKSEGSAGARSAGARRRATSAPAPVLARLALPAALLLAGPWVFLLHYEAGSVRRFTDVAAGFARFPRAYAYEELGKYYRKAEDVERATRMYELCVETYPTNGRFHVLLGSMYIRKYGLAQTPEEKAVWIGKAEASYREGARLQESDPHAVTYINLGRCLALQGKWAEAVEAHGRASQLDPNEQDNWVSLGNAFLKTGRGDDAIGAYSNALRLDPRLEVRAQLGAALLSRMRFEQAEEVFREALSLGREERRLLRHGLAAALVGQVEQAVTNGVAVPRGAAREGEELLLGILAESPDYEDARRLLGHLMSLLGSAGGGAGG